MSKIKGEYTVYSRI